MATFKFRGLDEYLLRLEKLTDARTYIGEAIYEGADIVADAMKAELQGLPVAQKFAKDGEQLSTITSVQKAGLVSGFGIARMRKDGDFYNVKLGFDGYNGQKTTQWPHGQPNAMIARSLVSGTSFRAKNDFVSRAMRTRTQAERAIKEKFEKEVKKTMN